MSQLSAGERVVEVAGIALAVVTAGWVLAVDGVHRDSVSFAVLVLVLGAVATAVLARRLARRWPSVVPLAVVVAPAGLVTLPGRSLVGDGAAGYANASGALYLLAAAAAVTLAVRTSDRLRRRLAWAAATGWALAVLLVRADAALVFVGLLALTLVVRRNLTLGQSGDALAVRIRTTRTDWNAVDEQTEAPAVFTDTRRRHLVVTHDGHDLRVYVDGKLRHRATGPTGSYASWNFTYPLLFGNEAGGERPWHGRLDAVAFHDRAMSTEQVAEAFAAGPSGAGRAGPDVAVARYTFSTPRDDMMGDTARRGLGPQLVRPSQAPGEPDGFAATLVDWRPPASAGPGMSAWVAAGGRVAAHAAVFAVFVALALRAIDVRPRVSRIVPATTMAAALLALAISAVRYLLGSSPSILEIGGAALGTALGSLLWTARRRRR